ncbi:MAG: hypothetical protein ACJAUO_000218 [Sediminicola sp.]|jgi:hypothetical protein
MYGHGIRKEIDGQPQKETYQKKKRSVFFDRVPVYE